MSRPIPVLPIIVISQFFCTSLWFASNAVVNDIISTHSLDPGSLGHITSAVQFGFILGTLVFAMYTIADRFSPSRVFLISAVLGAAFNLGAMLEPLNLGSLLFFRFGTGFFLAGIYPVGMKIASDYYEKGLGLSLGFLVGALVLGTSFPHLLKSISQGYHWKTVIASTSILASIGGLLMAFLVPDGPHRKKSQKIDFTAVFKVFRNRKLRSAAFGYFGHMWELYAFWAFIPLMIKQHNGISGIEALNVPLWSFAIIAVGGLACVVGGLLSRKFGTRKIASIALFLSGTCCLFSPIMLQIPYSGIFLPFLLFWGIAVIMDSPLFSTLVANNADPETKGTALTIVNSIGFAITIVSIQLLTALKDVIDPSFLYSILFIGPAAGLIGLYSGTKRAQ